MSHSSPPQLPSGPPPLPPAAATNAAAIASLVCGLLICVPFATGLAAVVLGIVGIKKGSDPRVGGRGMAIAGLIAGSLSLAVWLVLSLTFALGVWYIARESEPARQVAEQFTRDLASGNIDAALAHSAPGTDRAALVTEGDRIRSQGPLKVLGIDTFNFANRNGQSTLELKGIAVFEKSTRSFSMTLVSQTGHYKVSQFQFE